MLIRKNESDIKKITLIKIKKLSFNEEFQLV